MNNSTLNLFSRFASVLSGPGAILFLMFVAFTSFDAFVLAHFDIKLGPSGNVSLAALITGLALLCSTIGHIPACIIFRDVICQLSWLQLAAIILVLSLGQGVLLMFLDQFAASFIGMLVIWSADSAIMAVAVFALAKYKLKSASLSASSSAMPSANKANDD